MKFSEFAKYLQQLNSTTLRNEIVKTLSELFKKSSEKDIKIICYLLLGELAPSYQGIELNIAEKLMMQVIAKSFEVDINKVKSLFKKTGDLGDVAFTLSKTKENLISNLSIEDVYNKLLAITKQTGEGSQEKKITEMSDLLKQLDSLSIKFVIRIPIGKLRLGFSEATILDALSVLVCGDKSCRSIIEDAFNVTADIGGIAFIVKTKGINGLKNIEAVPGIPIRPSLAERVPTVEEILQKVGKPAAVEPKFDGFRIGIHLWHHNKIKEVKLFSRNGENMTFMFPDIVAAVKKLNVDSIILDGEAMGFNPKTNKFVSFQETVQRKRKYNILEMAQKLPLKVIVFDILYLNGKSLLNEKFVERRKILEKIFKNFKQINLVLNQQILSSDPNEIIKEREKVLNEGLEGLVIKNLEAPYQAGKRGFHWIKFKASAEALQKARSGGGGLLDTVDCLVMAAYSGKGKRAQFGFGGFLLGVRQGENYYTISKLGSGLSEEQFKEINKIIKPLIIDDKPANYVVIKDEKPDVWLEPRIVLEILADEITLSPKHTAGSQEGRGFSLRFPRLVRFRTDKNPEDITTVAEIKKLYKTQK
ncbi:MAG: ATP-dependent DNA ligase [Minisyncoccia bacterium]